MPYEDFLEAKHFFDHDEWEIAFEILLVWIIERNVEYEKETLFELEKIAKFCQLDVNGGHSDYYIWQKFQNYKSNSSGGPVGLIIGN